MMQINIKEAKTNLSKLLRLVETKNQDEIFIARNGKPVAKLVPVKDVSISNRIGVAEGKFEVPDDFDAGNEEIALMLTGGDI